MYVRASAPWFIFVAFQPLAMQRPYEMTTPVDLGNTSTSTLTDMRLLKEPESSSISWRSQELCTRYNEN